MPEDELGECPLGRHCRKRTLDPRCERVSVAAVGALGIRKSRGGVCLLGVGRDAVRIGGTGLA